MESQGSFAAGWGVLTLYGFIMAVMVYDNVPSYPVVAAAVMLATAAAFELYAQSTADAVAMLMAGVVLGYISRMAFCAPRSSVSEAPFHNTEYPCRTCAELVRLRAQKDELPPADTETTAVEPPGAVPAEEYSRHAQDLLASASAPVDDQNIPLEPHDVAETDTPDADEENCGQVRAHLTTYEAPSGSPKRRTVHWSCPDPGDDSDLQTVD